jgi:hypothetical protein
VTKYNKDVIMKILVLCWFLISCGGNGGSVPNSPEPFKPINLEGTWQLTITIPECDKKFKSTYYVALNESSKHLLSTMTSFGEYPDMDNMAACNSVMLPDIVDLDPYTTSSTAIQFKEFLSLRFIWVYDGIDITEYSDSQISLFRTIQTVVGERVWLYEFKRAKNLYGSMQRYNASSLKNGVIAVKGCKHTYNTTFYYRATFDSLLTTFRDSRYLEYLMVYNDNPSFLKGELCVASMPSPIIFLPTYYPEYITALEFRTMMQGVWGRFTEVLSWYPDEIQIIRMENGIIASYTFK